jgi:sRNA-binding regulator protein Hfq
MTLHADRRRSLLLASALFGLAVVASPAVHAATFTVINNDGAGEGFNDPTPAVPVGGNSGTTVGAQRLIAFQRAADIWGARLTSSVPIRVRAQFDALSCNATSGTLGSAGPLNFFRDFAGAPVAGTWFPVALANALRGIDLDPGGDDINATFNSNIGTPGCLTTSGWYYGLDGNAPGNQFDFVSVLLHELGHGLGFLTIVDLATGAKALGFNDTYMRFLENHGAAPADYPSMSNAQRVAASIATGNLHWVGANARGASGVLTAGKVGDHIRMFAPNPQQPGSSVSHWDTVLTPNQLMEPSYTGPLQDPVLELPLFQDIGWTVVAPTPLPPAPPPGPPCTLASHLGDFNGDGRADMMFRRTDGLISQYLMNGFQFLAINVLGAVGVDFTLVAVADFNGDGRADMLFRRASDGMLSLYLLNGPQLLGAQLLGAIGTDWDLAGVADFNGDGRADMLFRRRSDGMLSLYLMNGFQIQQAQLLGAIGTDFRVRGVADFNGDGRADILFRRESDGMLSLYLFNGFTNIGAQLLGAVGPDFRLLGVGDFNGDGRADMLFRRASDGMLSLYLLNGFQIIGAQLLGAVGTDFTLLGVGDLNGDGRADMLLRRSDGLLSAYLMNGFQLVAFQVLGTIGVDWALCYGQPPLSVAQAGGE